MATLVLPKEKEESQLLPAEEDQEEDGQNKIDDNVAKHTRSKTGPLPSLWKKDQNDDKNVIAIAQCLLVESLPTTVEEARAAPDAEHWETAMKDELESLIKNDTWTLVERPSDRKPIKNKWVFRVKTKPEGTIDKYKARLVIKGCSQKAGQDYSEGFSPVARYQSIRIVLAIATAKDFELVQFDVKTAFLYGDLDEIIYMEQPDGYKDGTDRICLLHRSLYGLKQAPKQWNKRIDELLRKFGLNPTAYDPCVYTTVEGDLIVTLYVDDGLIAGSSMDKIENLLIKMKCDFEITTSPIKCYLGLELIRDRIQENVDSSVSLHKKHYQEVWNG